MLIALLLATAATDPRGLLLKRANQGEVKAEVQLALSLQDAHQGPIDLAASEHWLRVAAATGDPEGELYLGRLLHLVPDAHHDFPEARYWYKKAADQGEARALNNLGWMYRNGDGVPRNWKVAGGFFRASARMGNSFGQRNYADWLVDHPNIGGGRYSSPRVDVAQVMDLYEKSAAQGDTDSMMKMAACYKRDNGLGIKETPAKYLEWTRRAAEAGNTDAMVSMGWACERGYGVPKDGAQALLWNEKAAEAGHLQAMTNLGILFQQGHVVLQDQAKAVAWFKRGDAAGAWTATQELAICYRDGDGVPKDPAEVVRLFEKAAGCGWGPAWLGLGHMYQDGAGIPKDPVKALDCYYMGARRWDATCVNNIGAFYEHGFAGEKDNARAWCWFHIAKKEGCGLAAQNLSSLEGHMGPIDKFRAARELLRIEVWLERARAEEKKRIDQELASRS